MELHLALLHHNSKIMLKKHYRKFLLIAAPVAGISILILSMPLPAHGSLIGVFFEWAGSVLDALDSIDQAILSKLITLVLYAFLSGAFAVLSAYLLEWAVGLQVHLSNHAVLAGFHFTVGLVNLFFILSFVFLGLAYILRIESIQTKKSFVRLILAVLLVNFSLLIVGGFIDVSQFMMNTIMTNFKSDFATTALIPLRNSLGSITSVVTTIIITYVARAFTVIGAPFALFFLIHQALYGPLISNIFSLVVLILLNLIMGLMFVIFAALFVLRIAALWLLGIFAPIGVFCFVFPQTKKYGWAWLTAVVQWASLGIVAFLLLGLVLSIFTQAFLKSPSAVGPSFSMSTPIPGLPNIILPSSLYNYLFLAIFLGVAFFGSIKYVPVGAQQVVGLIQSKLNVWGGMAGVTSIMKRGVKGAARRIVPEKVRRKAQEWATAPGLLTRKELKEMSAKQKVSRFMISPYAKRAFGRAITSVTVGADRDVFEETKKKIKGKSIEAKLEEYRKTTDLTKKAAILADIIESGQLKDAMDEKRFGKSAIQYDEFALTNSFRKLVRMGEEKAWKGMLRNFKNMHKEFEEILNKEGTVTKEDLKKKNYKSIKEYIVGETKKADDIKQLNKDWFKDEEFMEAVHKFWGGHQVGEAAKIFARKFTDAFNAEADKHDISWYFEVDDDTKKMRNPQLARYLASTGAMNAGLYPIKGGEDRKELEKRFRAGLEEEKRKQQGVKNIHEIIAEAQKQLAEQEQKKKEEQPSDTGIGSKNKRRLFPWGKEKNYPDVGKKDEEISGGNST